MSSSRWATSTPSRSMERGTSVGGPHTITRAPSFSRPWMLLRATRLWAMSPTRPTVSPSTRPLIRRMVKMSSRPCVGCSWAPSPALTTLQCRCWASRCGAPGTEWRTTTTSMPIASMFLAVSMNVSPLLTLEPPTVKSCVSAPRRLAAKPKLARVRVEGSKKRLTTTLPFRSPRFLRRRWLTSTNPSAVSRMVSISARLSSSRPSRWRRVQCTGLLSGAASCTVTVLVLLGAGAALRRWPSWLGGDVGRLAC